jgi:hypothetical protein
MRLSTPGSDTRRMLGSWQRATAQAFLCAISDASVPPYLLR